jgi:hypothetical protein
LVRYAASIGLKPQELYGMTYAQFNNYQLGYSDYMKTQAKNGIARAIYSGHFAGYYNNAKHAKKPSEFINDLYKPEPKLMTKKEFEGQAQAVGNMAKRLGII